MNPFIDHLSLIFFCMLTNIPYEPTVDALELVMKAPAVLKMKEQIQANQNGIHTPIQEKTVDDAIDAVYKVTEKYNEEIYANDKSELANIKRHSKEFANILKRDIKKKLAEENILM